MMRGMYSTYMAAVVNRHHVGVGEWTEMGGWYRKCELSVRVPGQVIDTGNSRIASEMKGWEFRHRNWKVLNESG